MSLTKQMLQNNFNRARETGAPYIFVAVKADGITEVIVIPEQSFEAKEHYYQKAYDDNLVHVMNKNVEITGLSYGELDELKNII